MLSSVRAWFAYQERVARELQKENKISVVLSVLALNLVGKRVVFPVSLFGERLFIRTATPDLFVAIETLGSEFAVLADLSFSDSSLFIIDAGGYIGTASIALKSLFPDSVIVCLEPSSENFEMLKKNIEGIEGIHAVNVALVDYGMPEELYLEESPTGPWGFHLTEVGSATTEPVKTTTFLKVMKDYGASRVHICKMDIEGGEHPLLLRPESWLHDIDALVIELHERKREGIDELFRLATISRLNIRLQGEKILSLSQTYLANFLSRQEEQVQCTNDVDHQNKE